MQHSFFPSRGKHGYVSQLRRQGKQPTHARQWSTCDPLPDVSIVHREPLQRVLHQRWHWWGTS